MRLPSRLPIPDDVVRIANTLESAGHETWCVGGAVRDNLLGYENKDFDLATSATPAEVQRLFRRTVPVGVEHGTVAVLDKENRPHEVTTFRKDVKTDGRHAVVEFGVSLDDDLARRDFTINAIAYHPLKHEWRDPYKGIADLERKVLRAVGDPHQRFREDYLRILRLLRFAARFGFAIEPETWEAAVESADGLRHLSAERVNAEWFRGLENAERPSRLVHLWMAVGAVPIWLPDCENGESGVGPSAEGITPDSRLPIVDRLPRDPVLITAFLSSDPEGTLRRLKCSRAEIERARRIAQYRGREPDPTSDVDVRRWLATVGDAADDLIAIAKAEGKGDALETAVKRVRASGAPLTIGDLAVDGSDLMTAGVPEGPAVGETLRGLLELALENPSMNTKEMLLDVVRTLPPSPFPRGSGGTGEAGTGATK
jgi:tRNA nucleotidyltransferase (CCA-adding enzyme)